jgi:hypothetical protein
VTIAFVLQIARARAIAMATEEMCDRADAGATL